MFVGVLAPHAYAQTSKDKRVQQARDTKPAEVSDGQLAQAVKTLDAQVKATDAQTQSARQSVKSARISVALAEARLRQAESALQRVRGQLVARALAEYKQQGNFDNALASGDISEAIRRKALLDHVTKVDNDVLDQLHATRDDITRQRAAAQRAKATADARERVVEERLRQLVRDRASRGRLNAALEKRIAEVRAEAIAIEGDDSVVRRILGASPTPSSGDVVVGKTSKYGLQWPLRGRLTSGFGRRWGRLHAGIDIAAPKGTPIHAAKAGTVVFAGQMHGYGNVVIIDHGGGLSTLYGHQSRLGSHRGERVSQGQTIGYVGSTGHSTGNHCHFETRINGKPQNPRNFLP